MSQVSCGYSFRRDFRAFFVFFNLKLYSRLILLRPIALRFLIFDFFYADVNRPGLYKVFYGFGNLWIGVVRFFMDSVAGDSFLRVFNSCWGFVEEFVVLGWGLNSHNFNEGVGWMFLVLFFETLGLCFVGIYCLTALKRQISY